MKNGQKTEQISKINKIYPEKEKKIDKIGTF